MTENIVESCYCSCLLLHFNPHNQPFFSAVQRKHLNMQFLILWEHKHYTVVLPRDTNMATNRSSLQSIMYYQDAY